MSGLRQQKAQDMNECGGVKGCCKTHYQNIIIIMVGGSMCTLYCYLFALLLFCFRRCCHLFFPKDKYFLFYTKKVK